MRSTRGVERTYRAAKQGPSIMVILKGLLTALRLALSIWRGACGSNLLASYFGPSTGTDPVQQLLELQLRGRLRQRRGGICLCTLASSNKWPDFPRNLFCIGAIHERGRAESDVRLTQMGRALEHSSFA